MQNRAIHTAVINGDSGRNEGETNVAGSPPGSAGRSRCQAIRYPTWRPFRAPTNAKRPPLAHSTITACRSCKPKCHDDGTDKFLCEIRFIAKGEQDPDEDIGAPSSKYDAANAFAAGSQHVLKTGEPTAETKTAAAAAHRWSAGSRLTRRARLQKSHRLPAFICGRWPLVGPNKACSRCRPQKPRDGNRGGGEIERSDLERPFTTSGTWVLPVPGPLLQTDFRAE
jgi:hypothetical protein